MAVLGDFKDWMALAFVRQIRMFDKFAPGILAVIKGREMPNPTFVAATAADRRLMGRQLCQ